MNISVSCVATIIRQNWKFNKSMAFTCKVVKSYVKSCQEFKNSFLQLNMKQYEYEF